MAVTMDLAEHHMFCGGSDGSIFQVDLCTRVSGWDSWEAMALPVPRLGLGQHQPGTHACPGLHSLHRGSGASSQSRTLAKSLEATGGHWGRGRAILLAREWGPDAGVRLSQEPGDLPVGVHRWQCAALRLP